MHIFKQLGLPRPAAWRSSFVRGRCPVAICQDASSKKVERLDRIKSTSANHCWPRWPKGSELTHELIDIVWGQLCVEEHRSLRMNFEVVVQNQVWPVSPPKLCFVCLTGPLWPKLTEASFSVQHCHCYLELAQPFLTTFFTTFHKTLIASWRFPEEWHNTEPGV